LSIEELRIALPEGSDRDYAVDGISFDVLPGEVVCLVGESGSGKSVVAHAIMGLLPDSLTASTGSIRLLGEDVLHLPEKHLRQMRGVGMAMVFQEPMTALNPVVRCGAQVDEMLAQHTALRPADRKRKVLDIFAKVNLADPQRMYDAYPHQLSGGQRQRIVIAIAMILRPALLICDEPTTALDVSTQVDILELIRDLQRENGTAVLFITHDFGVVAEIADKVVVLEQGRQVECGATHRVLASPEHPYTQMLLCAVPRLEPTRSPVAKDAPLLLEARNISKSYKAGSWPSKNRIVHAADKVSLSVHAGETVGIIGESGSGKSTLARCIAGLIEPDGGSVTIPPIGSVGTPRAQRSAFRRSVQMVFQDPNRSLNPRRTVGQSVIEGPVNFGVPAGLAWRRAEALMEQVRLPVDALHRYPHEFSGGQRQRLCIARALACEPKVLIADEAVSSLDVSVQDQILTLLADLQHQLGFGMLFISHDLRVASRICNRLVVMHKGKIVEEGAISDVLLQRRHHVTEALLASVPGQGRPTPAYDGRQYFKDSFVSQSESTVEPCPIRD
jgi:peptide/nickel transport system ATP-binding protein